MPNFTCFNLFLPEFISLLTALRSSQLLSNNVFVWWISWEFVYWKFVYFSFNLNNGLLAVYKFWAHSPFKTLSWKLILYCSAFALRSLMSRLFFLYTGICFFFLEALRLLCWSTIVWIILLLWFAVNFFLNYPIHCSMYTFKYRIWVFLCLGNFCHYFFKCFFSILPLLSF